jgi:hypothetical protein
MTHKLFSSKFLLLNVGIYFFKYFNLIRFELGSHLVIYLNFEGWSTNKEKSEN